MAITNTLSAKSLIALRLQVDAQNIDPQDTAAVAAIWQDMNTDARATHIRLTEEKTQLTKRLEKLRAELIAIEDTYPLASKRTPIQKQP